MKTQNAVLLAELKKRNVTAYYCITKLGIGSPTRRINDLRVDGYDIKTIRTPLKTRWGKSIIATWELK